jgi:starch synthase
VRPLRIAQACAELAPFAKTGGLGDVAAALARHLHRAGHDVRPFVPLYASLAPGDRPFAPVDFLQDVPLRMGGRTLAFSVFTTTIPGSDCAAYFVACPALYGRPGVYSADPDEHVRQAFLSRAAIECCQRMGFAPDVFHVHDWHTALVPLYLKTLYAWDRLFHGTRTVLTLHNLAYQGRVGAGALADVGLEEHASRLHQEHLAEGWFGFLETGLLHADAVTAVSETYAREIQTPEHGFGLDGLLRARARSVVGIVNGIDTDLWAPASDPLIPHPYAADDLSGKAACKAWLLSHVGLAATPDPPVVGVVSRLTAQKGFELAFDLLPALLWEGRIRLVGVGSGAPGYESFFRELTRRFPAAAAFHVGYDEALAHQIEAGADLFLMPSRFEPCGLNQMYSLRYGTAPVVHRTGGLADTVEPFDVAKGTGTGFVFEHFTRQGLAWAMEAALALWPRKEAWARMVRNGMAKDFSWERQVQRYLALYRAVLVR